MMGQKVTESSPMKPGPMLATPGKTAHKQSFEGTATWRLQPVLKSLCWFLDANQLRGVKVPSLSLKGREEGNDPGKPTCS